MDEFGKPGWIALTVLAFIVFWPLGFAILAYLFWSGRMACWKHEKWARRWGAHGGGWEHMRGASDRMHAAADHMHETADRWFGGFGRRQAPSSGNWAFDEYREETIRRLEDEQREFLDFLQRLRRAKDKEEFDQFLAERRRPSAYPPQDPPSPHAEV
jgi:hypothetical protein